MIRVHLTEGAPAAEVFEGMPVAAADPDWKTLDDLARTALLLARRLCEQQEADDRGADAGKGADRAEGADGTDAAESDATVVAVTTADLFEDGRDRSGAARKVPAARDRPGPQEC